MSPKYYEVCVLITKKDLMVETTYERLPAVFTVLNLEVFTQN